MKIIRAILDRPLIVMLITTIIALIYSDGNRYALGIICAIFIISIIYTVFQKKWLRLVLSVLGYILFFIFWFIMILFKGFSDELKPEIETGDSNFYSKEISKSLNLKVPEDLKIISKIDTIVYMGMENEYNAECLYTGSKKIILELENNILAKKEFIKINELDAYPTKVLTQDNFNLNELKSVYKKESEGSYIIYIAFNKNYTKFYYSAFYY
jgi:energy-coupling factor transporter transmembrane protein EcfT